ncbi:hypothetical protein CY34DRAFT_14927 [Suillus luteus UH-Slu-Lm8-n1]|uniref:C2H2-type domain-containing protein n=1 Tax=Suillus luteus UH-Slu-Lm8-n1 TaxID=930992 RepID=A0A0D0AA11_9AGAM|nr:hypothetical protein CY34DRAFT_14927 [Suillus luteus UH-Slu-Lm8-n1]
MSQIHKYTCSAQADCKQTFAKFADLKKHQAAHSPDAYHCTWAECDFATLKKSSYDIHYAKHTGEQREICPHEGCNYKTHDPALLTRHRTKRHGYVPLVRGRGASAATGSGGIQSASSSPQPQAQPPALTSSFRSLPQPSAPFHQYQYQSTQFQLQPPQPAQFQPQPHATQFQAQPPQPAQWQPQPMQFQPHATQFQAQPPQPAQFQPQPIQFQPHATQFQPQLPQLAQFRPQPMQLQPHATQFQLQPIQFQPQPQPPTQSQLQPPQPAQLRPQPPRPQPSRPQPPRPQPPLAQPIQFQPHSIQSLPPPAVYDPSLGVLYGPSNTVDEYTIYTGPAMASHGWTEGCMCPELMHWCPSEILESEYLSFLALHDPTT